MRKPTARQIRNADAQAATARARADRFAAKFGRTEAWSTWEFDAEMWEARAAERRAAAG